MKKLITVAVLFFISIHFGFSQSYFGVKAGANISNVNIDNEYLKVFNSNIENRIGFQFGLIAQKEINDKVYIRPELFYSSKGYKVSGNQTTEEQTAVRYSYINIPVLIGYKLIPKLSTFLGPQLGLLGKVIRKDASGESFNMNSGRDYNTVDFSFGAGVNYQLTTRISTDLRYNYGLTTILNTSYNDKTESDLIKNNKSFEISINYLFRSKE